MRIRIINKIAGLLLILLSMSVVIPLSIITIKTGGGTSGFGIIGLPVLLPLSAYLLFGIAAWLKFEARQRRIFIAAHIITFSTGLIGVLLFPVYPKPIVLIPLALAVFGIANKRNFKYYLFLMIFLAIAANILLLKWELEFDRTLPLFQLFQSSRSIDP